MNCELLIPALFRSQGFGDAERLPALEILLARGRRSNRPALALEPWLAEAFGCGDEPLAAGALTLLAAGNTPQTHLWTRADPVHQSLNDARVTLVPAAACAITRDEAAALTDALNRHFAGALTIFPAYPDGWCAQGKGPWPTDSEPPLEFAGRAIEPARARHRGTPHHALLNEIEMLLHAHPVNQARAARGAPALNSVWFWGAGALPASVSATWRSVSADEPNARGLAIHAGVAPRALPGHARAWLDALPAEGRHLAVLDRLRLPCALGDDAACRDGLRALEASWFMPLLDALRGNRVGMVTLHIPDTGDLFEITRADLRRFWRRRRPVAAYAGAGS